MTNATKGPAAAARARSRRRWLTLLVVVLGAGACLLDGRGARQGGERDGGPTPDAADDGDSDATPDADGEVVADGDLPDADADADAEEPCVPQSCESLDFECGRHPDPCLGELDCGPCSTGGCRDGRCVPVIYVKADATGLGTGSSWADAFPTVQQAVDAAGDAEIWVAAGTYEAEGSAQVVTLAPGTALHGGFAGTELDFGERQLAAGHESALDGGASRPVVVGASDARLDGFTIRNGFSAAHGAGISLQSCSGFTLASCLVQGNVAQSFGGGLYLTSGSSASIVGCVFEANQATHGGGIFSEHSSLDLDSTQFRRNSVVSPTGGGGAIDNHYSPATISNCLFIGNQATPYFGGAIYNLGTEAHVVIRHSTFFGNVASHHGGAIFDNSGAGNDIANSIFWSNTPEELFDWSGAGVTTIRYSDVEGGWPGEGNIDGDPQFSAAASDDLSLGAGSPCVDAADGARSTPFDLLGAPRVDDPEVPNTGTGDPAFADLGALERQLD